MGVGVRGSLGSARGGEVREVMFFFPLSTARTCSEAEQVANRASSFNRNLFLSPRFSKANTACRADTPVIAARS